MPKFDSQLARAENRFLAAHTQLHPRYTEDNGQPVSLWDKNVRFFVQADRGERERERRVSYTKENNTHTHTQ